MDSSKALSWFEIPTVDVNRAQKFYESIFDVKLINGDNTQLKMRMFPQEGAMGVGGALVLHKEFYTPSERYGALLYLNANPDVQIVLDRVEQAGGKIMMKKTQISPQFGYMALFLDTEGNRIGLHSVPTKDKSELYKGEVGLT